MAAPKPNFSSSIWLIVAGLVVISALGLFGGGGRRGHATRSRTASSSNISTPTR